MAERAGKSSAAPRKRTRKQPESSTATAPQHQQAAPESLPVARGERPWTAAQLAKVRTELRRESEDIRGEITGMDADLADLIRDGGDQSGEDQADTGTRTFEREMEMSLAAGQRDILAQVERALERMDDGTYGVCEACGQPIGKARLQAFPRATLCMADKQRLERR